MSFFKILILILYCTTTYYYVLFNWRCMYVWYVLLNSTYLLTYLFCTRPGAKSWRRHWSESTNWSERWDLHKQGRVKPWAECADCAVSETWCCSLHHEPAAAAAALSPSPVLHETNPSSTNQPPVSRPLCRPTGVSRHLQLRTGGFLLVQSFTARMPLLTKPAHSD